MIYQHTVCTTVTQRIRHNDPHAAPECETLENNATKLENNATNHDCTGSHKKGPIYAGQTFSVINNDRKLLLPAIVV